MYECNTSYVANNSYAVDRQGNSTVQYAPKNIDNSIVVSKEKRVDYNEKAFEDLAPNAPEEVKDAWMEAAKEIGVNGMGMLQNGMLGHITQMAAQKAVKWHNGEQDYTDILGNSVESAIQKTKEALFHLKNPLSPNYNRPIEVQHQLIKEKEFYESFLEKLENIAKKS